MAKILTLTLNPALDITIGLDTLRPGHVNRSLAQQSHAAPSQIATPIRITQNEAVMEKFIRVAPASGGCVEIFSMLGVRCWVFDVWKLKKHRTSNIQR